MKAKYSWLIRLSTRVFLKIIPILCNLSIFILFYSSHITVPPDEKIGKKFLGNRNSTSQRNQIRVLNKSNIRRNIESNPNLESYFGSPRTIQETHSNPITCYSSQTAPRIITSPSGTKTFEQTLSKHGSREEPPIGSPSNESVVGSLPRTLSTSVLRIKHRRTFWERVVG